MFPFLSYKIKKTKKFTLEKIKDCRMLFSTNHDKNKRVAEFGWAFAKSFRLFAVNIESRV